MLEGSELPSVSVIVPALEGLQELIECVQALLEQDYPAELLDVIVADNGSALDPSEYLPRDARLRVIIEPRPGSYTARNAALQVATGDVIAFTDADCRPERTWLRAAVEALDADPPADMVGGAVELVFASSGPVSGAEWYEHLNGFPQQEYLKRGFAVTANLITRRSVVARVGLFDASLASGGDAEWCRRIRDSGGIQRYAPLARVRHPARATRADLLTKSRRTTRGVATKALRAAGGRRTLVRMLLGQARAAGWLTVSIWRSPEPAALRAKVAYLGVFWANASAVSGELVRSLRRYST